MHNLDDFEEGDVVFHVGAVSALFPFFEKDIFLGDVLIEEENFGPFIYKSRTKKHIYLCDPDFNTICVNYKKFPNNWLLVGKSFNDDHFYYN